MGQSRGLATLADGDCAARTALRRATGPIRGNRTGELVPTTEISHSTWIHAALMTDPARGHGPPVGDCSGSIRSRERIDLAVDRFLSASPLSNLIRVSSNDAS